MPWFLLVGICVLCGGGTFVYLALMTALMRHALGVTDFLLYLVGAGILFAVGYFTARLAFDVSEQLSLTIGVVLPLVYGAGRLTWIKLGLPTPWSDYERWRDEDHREYWNY